MTRTIVNRRQFLVAATAAALWPRTTLAADVIDITWEDLLPEGADAPKALTGVINHDSADLAASQPVSSGVRRDWNDRTVRLPGFIVPLELDADGVTSFILVPYVGACIHVPPPPANQLVLVNSAKPYTSSGLFEPVSVTGVLNTASTSTDLAETGYVMEASKVKPY